MCVCVLCVCVCVSLSLSLSLYIYSDYISVRKNCMRFPIFYLTHQVVYFVYKPVLGFIYNPRIITTVLYAVYATVPYCTLYQNSFPFLP